MCGVGRSLGVGIGLGVIEGVGLGIGVPLGEGVTVGLGVGVGPDWAQYLPPVDVTLAKKEEVVPPQMIISPLVQTAV